MIVEKRPLDTQEAGRKFRLTRSRSVNIKYIVIVALVLIALSALALPPLLSRAASSVTTDDWPTSLHDVMRTSASNDTTFSNANVAQLVKAWSFKTGGVIASSPTVTGGTAYFGSWDGYEYAVDATTGVQKWKTYLGVTTPNSYCNPNYLGISSAAAVQNGMVYVGGGDSNWYALDATTGTVAWKVYTGDNSAAGGHYNWSSPLLYNGYAYIGIASEGDCPLVQGQLLKVNLSTHQIEVTFNFVPNGQVGGGVWTSPAVDASTNTVFVATGTDSLTSQIYAQSVVALDASTLAVKSYWHLPESQAINDSDFGTSTTLFTDSNGDQLLSTTNKNGYVYVFNRNNLAAGPLWRANVALGGQCPVPCGQGTVSSAAFGNGKLYAAGEDTVINGVGYQGSVNAIDPATGNFLWQHGTTGPVIGAVTYVNGLVIDGGGSTLEVLDANTGKRLASYTTGGWLYAAPSVANGKIYVGGVDNNVYAFNLPTTTATPPPDPNCPTGWVCQDIGTPTPAGSETVANGTWTVNAGGTGVTGAADQFRLMSQSVSGDTQVAAKIVSQQATSTQAQAGLMIRQRNDTGAPYYGAFYTKSNGLVVQYRTQFGGTTTQATTQAVSALPVYVEVQRVGDQLQTATSTDGTTYTLVPGSTVTLPLPDTAMVGLAASSSVSGSLETVAYSNVSIGAPTTPDTPPTASPCPTGWSCQGIGNPAVVGDQTLANGVWTIKGAGQGISGYSDQFHYVSQSLTGDILLSAHLATQANTSADALSGLMIRQDTTASSPYYAILVTPGNGINVQVRFPNGPDAVTLTTVPGAAPAYLQIERSGNTFSAYTSTDGVNWTYVPATSMNLTLPTTMLAGLAVASGLVTTTGTSTFDTVKLSGNASPPPTLCPTDWSCNDIGYPTPAGEQVLNAGTWTVRGGGSDIWNTNDEFRYISQSLASDGSVSAHIVSQQNTDPYAKAGVMIRQSTDPGAANYAVFVTPGNGITVQYRATALTDAAVAASITGTAPQYLKVVKVGNAFTAYTSPDGANWTAIPGSTVNITMTGPVMAGLAITSHNSTQLGTAVFDTVNIGAPVACPANWNCADVGAPVLAGSQTVNGNTWTMQAAGGDIWGTNDQFHYIWQALTTDGSVSAHVASQTSTDPWAKAGVMLRQSTDPGDIFYGAFVTPGNGIAVQYRTAIGASAAMVANISGTVPQYLRVSKVGTTFTAYMSSDGNTWTAIPGSTVTLNMSGMILAGAAATSHNTGTLGTIVFDSANIGTATNYCPTNWNCADVGNPPLTGSQVYNGGTWTMQGSGGDIWGTNDQFRYAWQSLTADGSVSAHVVSQTNTNPWAKAGVMLRQSTDPASPYYDLVVTPSNGITVQYRTTSGGGATSAVITTGATPIYIKVNRVGTTFTAYTSPDGVNWTAIAGSSVTLNMTGTIDAGIVDTSHDNGQLSTAVFDTVVIGAP